MIRKVSILFAITLGFIVAVVIGFVARVVWRYYGLPEFRRDVYVQ